MPLGRVTFRIRRSLDDISRQFGAGMARARSYSSSSKSHQRSTSNRVGGVDSLVLWIIPLGLFSVVGEAYLRTDLNDADSPADCAYVATSQLLQAQHVRTLEREGLVVIPNALSQRELDAARRDLFDFTSSTNVKRDTGSSEDLTDSTMSLSTNDADVRQDKVAWVRATENDQGDNDSDTVGPHLTHCIRLIRGLTHSLESHNYTRAGSSTTAAYRIPPKCQLAWYPGDGEAVYHRHLDQCRGSIWELGLLEWLRLSDYRERSITVIIYLNNSDRPVSDGGALRCWVAKDNNDETTTNLTGSCDARQFEAPFDIQPVGGTVVIFQSDKVEHMVLSSLADRFALTSWIAKVPGT